MSPSTKNSNAVTNSGRGSSTGTGTVKKKKMRSLKKAPQAPKRFKSSYILFFIHVQQRIKASLPPGQASAPEVSKRASELWKALSAEDRLHWDNEAAKEKQRYLDEKKVYTGPWQIPHKRAKKDPTAPKRNPSAFLLFSLTKRKELKVENPTLKNTEISRILGELWRETSDEVKAPFIEREEMERKKYKEDIAAWREKKAEEDKCKQKEREEDFRMKVREMEGAVGTEGGSVAVAVVSAGLDVSTEIDLQNRVPVKIEQPQEHELQHQYHEPSVSPPSPQGNAGGGFISSSSSSSSVTTRPVKVQHMVHNQNQSPQSQPHPHPQSHIFQPHHHQHRYSQEASPLTQPGSYGAIDNYQYSTNTNTASAPRSNGSTNGTGRQAQDSWSLPLTSSSPSYQHQQLLSNPMNSNMQYRDNQSPTMSQSHHSTQGHLSSSHQMSNDKFNAFDIFQSQQNQHQHGPPTTNNSRDSFSSSPAVEHTHSFFDTNNHHHYHHHQQQQQQQQQHRSMKFEDSSTSGIGAIGGHESPYPPYPEEFEPVPIH